MEPQDRPDARGEHTRSTAHPLVGAGSKTIDREPATIERWPWWRVAKCDNTDIVFATDR